MRALEMKKCEQVMHLITGCQDAINGVLPEVVEEQILTHRTDLEKTSTPLIKLMKPSPDRCVVAPEIQCAPRPLYRPIQSTAAEPR
jgi:hypothetical protein